MSLLGAYKKKTSYDGYESLQLVDSGGESFGAGRGSSGSSGSSALGGSAAATLGPKAGPLREEDCSTMDSSGKSAQSPGNFDGDGTNAACDCPGGVAAVDSVMAKCSESVQGCYAAPEIPTYLEY